MSMIVSRGAIEEELDALGAEHIGDLVRIADHRGDAIGQHAAVEFMRGDERGFDVQMRVDEAGHDDPAGNVDLGCALIIRTGADDAVAADGDIGCDKFARHQIEEATALQHEVGWFAAGALVDEVGKCWAHVGSYSNFGAP